VLAFPQTPAHSRTRLLSLLVSANEAQPRPANGKPPQWAGILPVVSVAFSARADVQLTRGAYSVRSSIWEDQFSLPKNPSVHPR